MSDKDRAAFESALETLNLSASNGYSCEDHPFNPGEYLSEQTHYAWQIWQAARDHYAPELTEKELVEALEIRAETIDAECDDGYSSAKLMIGIGEALSALRAAGVRFKEEA